MLAGNVRLYIVHKSTVHCMLQVYVQLQTIKTAHLQTKQIIWVA